MKITICGSTRFSKQFLEWNKRLTLAGHIVYSLGWERMDINIPETPTPQEKEILDLVHLQKIAESDAIFVLDIDGYVGESTRREMLWATMLGKDVYSARACELDINMGLTITNLNETLSAEILEHDKRIRRTVARNTEERNTQ